MPKILSCLKKRDLLHNPQINSDQLVQYGHEYFNQDRLADTLDFFEKAKDTEGIRRIMEQSIEEGDPFLLHQSSKLLKEVATDEAWRKVGEKALANGRFQQALMAFKAVHDEEQTLKIQMMLRS